MVGFAMLLGAKSPGARYAGTFLGAMGIYPAISNTISWASNNTEGNTTQIGAHIQGYYHRRVADFGYQ
jgi:hypothetical protein